MAPTKPAAETKTMTPYHCKNGHYLFESDATEGRLRIPCPVKACHRLEFVFLGGHFKKRVPADQPGLSDVVSLADHSSKAPATSSIAENTSASSRTSS